MKFVLMLALAISSMCVYADIPVLSVDESGNEVVTTISDAEYSKATSLKADAFAQAADDQVDMALLAPHLTLKGILIGLEAAGSVGPAPLKIGAAINQQFYFELKK